METFGPPREFVEHPGFEEARASALARFRPDVLDPPIADLISAFSDLSHCFTLQSCHGHFVCGADDAPDTGEPIPDQYSGPVTYRIAYLALCIEAGDRGRALRDALASVVETDHDYVQFGSPGWFWDQWVNSYALQVEPVAWRFEDTARLDAEEARHVERVRDRFFLRLRTIVVKEKESCP